MWNPKPPRSDSRRFYYYINYQRRSSYTPNSAMEACPLVLSISIFTLLPQRRRNDALLLYQTYRLNKFLSTHRPFRITNDNSLYSLAGL